jgi:hypothetical protein
MASQALRAGRKQPVSSRVDPFACHGNDAVDATPARITKASTFSSSYSLLYCFDYMNFMFGSAARDESNGSAPSALLRGTSKL